MPISEDRMAINTTIYVPKTQLPTTSNAEDLISFDDTSLVDPVDEGGFARYSQESGSSSGTSGFAWLAQDGLMGHDVLSVDGPAERSKRWKQEQPIAAIFIHAGAGYHSTANENIHLQACSL
jgi:hypothetical protein